MLKEAGIMKARRSSQPHKLQVAVWVAQIIGVAIAALARLGIVHL